MNRKEFLKVLLSVIGFSAVLGSLIIFLYIFVLIVVFDGVILYEFNKIVSILEFFVVILAILYTIYIFKKEFWNLY